MQEMCVPSLGGALVEGNGDPLQCSCLGNSVDRGAWEATIQGRHKSKGNGFFKEVDTWAEKSQPNMD